MSDSQNKNRHAYLDLARFFAICGVLLVHTAEISHRYFPDFVYNLGRLGVQLFFLVSGITVANSYLKLQAHSNFTSIFYIKRLFRILPLFIFCGVYYSIKNEINLGEILMPWRGLMPNNIDLIRGGWSIWNEIYFYLFFPAYFWIRKVNYRFVVLLVAFVSLTILISTRFFDLFNDTLAFRDFDYLNIFTQFICFSIGVEYQFDSKKRIILSFLIYFIFSIFYKSLFFSDFIFVADYGASYWTALIGVMSLFFLLGLKKILAYFPVESSNILLRIGRVTYTSYMLHFLIIDFLANKISHMPTEINFLIICGITFPIAIYLQPFTETIWVKLGQKIINRFYGR